MARSESRRISSSILRAKVRMFPTKAASRARPLISDSNCSATCSQSSTSPRAGGAFGWLQARDCENTARASDGSTLAPRSSKCST